MKKLLIIAFNLLLMLFVSASFAQVSSVLGCQSLKGTWTGAGTILTKPNQRISINISDVSLRNKTPNSSIYNLSGTLNGNPLTGSTCTEIKRPEGPAVTNVGFQAAGGLFGYASNVNSAMPTRINLSNISGATVSGDISK